MTTIVKARLAAVLVVVYALGLVVFVLSPVTATTQNPAWVSDLTSVTLHLTSAEIKALRANPAVLVPAPGAGRIARFVDLDLFLVYGTGPFTESGDNLAVKYGGAAGVAVSETIEMTGFLTSAGDAMTTGQARANAIAMRPSAENQPLVLHNLGNDEFGGNAGDDSVLQVVVRYRVVAAWTTLEEDFQ